MRAVLERKRGKEDGNLQSQTLRCLHTACTVHAQTSRAGSARQSVEGNKMCVPSILAWNLQRQSWCAVAVWTTRNMLVWYPPPPVGHSAVATKNIHPPLSATLISTDQKELTGFWLCSVLNV